MKHVEDDEQIALIKWARLYLFRGEPLSDYLFHIPNGGKRSKVQGAIFKRLGVKAGVSDLFLPIPVGGQPGLWLEMKPPKKYKSRVSESQDVWLKRMLKQGYAAFVCYGWEDARERILEYLGEIEYAGGRTTGKAGA